MTNFPDLIFCPRTKSIRKIGPAHLNFRQSHGNARKWRIPALVIQVSTPNIKIGKLAAG